MKHLHLAWSAALLLAAPAVAADDVFTAEHVTNIRSVTAAEISPDGRHVAYTLSVPRKPFQDENGGAYAELHIVDRDGSSRPYITGAVNIGGIRWTHDGSAVTFLAKRGDDEHRSLYRIPVGGGESRRILAHDNSISSYTFSPDGKRVAFLSTDKEEDRSEKLKKKGFNAEVYEESPRWTRVWIATLDGDEEPRALELEGQPSELHWSPAGDHLALALSPSPFIDDHYMARKVHVIDANDGSVVARFDNPGKLGQIAWSPDGAHIAFISAEDIHDPSEGRLMVAKATGGPLNDIVPDFMGHITAIAWQNNDTLMFLGDEGCYTSFEEVRADGSERHAIVAGGAHAITGLSLSNGSLSAAVRVDSPAHPPEVYVISHTETTPKRLTHSNEWMNDLRMAKQEVVRYKARDGKEIEGILIHPLDRDEERRYPLILAVHGGPEAHIKNGWLTRYSYPGQVAAAEGIATFYPNYRGSTGRGVAFSKLGQADYGGGEFDDLVDAVDHFIATGLADQDKIGVTGGSYGGFATAWCSTKHTHRFAAGVMFVGISDQISKSGTTDIPNEMFLVHARKRMWDDWQFYLERSPIYYVQQARTPILIMHGKDDPRVHPSQSLELYRQLKVVGKTPARLVWYPGEGHGNRKAAARYDYNLRMMRWFLHYLKGDGGAPPPPELEYALEEKKDDAAEPSG